MNPFKQIGVLNTSLKSPEVTNSMKKAFENAVTLDLGKSGKIIVIGEGVSKDSGLAKMFAEPSPSLSPKAEKELSETGFGKEKVPNKSLDNLETEVIESLMEDAKKSPEDMSDKGKPKRKEQIPRVCSNCGETRQTRIYPEDEADYVCHLCKKRKGKKK